MSSRPARFEPNLARRKRIGQLAHGLGFVVSLFGVVVLVVLILRIAYEGAGVISWHFLTEPASFLAPLEGGISQALQGTLWLIGLTAVISIPIGIAAAVYLEEYAPHNAVTKFIQLNIANLAGVPSVVYGILGLTVFVRWMKCGPSIVAGALTLSLLVLPVIIISSREALAAVPKSIRLAAFALGATQWQTIRHHVLPAALPGIMTGLILAMSRAIGEAAPLLLVGAVAYMTDLPQGLFDQFQVLPLTVYFASDRPDEDSRRLAAATILVLLGVLLAMNAIAVTIRAVRSTTRN